MSKAFDIKRIAQTGLWRIGLTGGGEVPDALKGGFTSKKLAEDRIARYTQEQMRDHQEKIEKRKARSVAA